MRERFVLLEIGRNRLSFDTTSDSSPAQRLLSRTLRGEAGRGHANLRPLLASDRSAPRPRPPARGRAAHGATLSRPPGIRRPSDAAVSVVPGWMLRHRVSVPELPARYCDRPTLTAGARPPGGASPCWPRRADSARPPCSPQPAAPRPRAAYPWPDRPWPTTRARRPSTATSRSPSTTRASTCPHKPARCPPTPRLPVSAHRHAAARP